MSRHFIIPIFVPHLGCPHECIFCNQRKIANASTNINQIDVKDTINKYLNYFNKDAFIEIAFYGGSFTAIDMEIQKKFLSVALEYKNQGLINEIRISTRPDTINHKTLQHLKRYNVDTIELGVQSMDQKVLDASERGHSIEESIESSNLIKKYKFKLGLQMMVGLPESSLETELFTVKKFINLSPDTVRIYPTLAIKDTYLEKLIFEKKYKTLSIDMAVEISSILLCLFKLNNINVIRIGLQATENIQLGKDIVDGPFHPAFRQLVESSIYRNIIDHYLDFNNKNVKDKVLKIKARNKIISDIVGQNSFNKQYWIKKYNLSDMKFYPESTREIILFTDEFEDELNLNNLLRLHLKKYFERNNIQYNLRDFNIC